MPTCALATPPPTTRTMAIYGIEALSFNQRFWDVFRVSTTFCTACVYQADVKSSLVGNCSCNDVDVLCLLPGASISRRHYIRLLAASYVAFLCDLSGTATTITRTRRERIRSIVFVEAQLVRWCS